MVLAHGSLAKLRGGKCGVWAETWGGCGPWAEAEREPRWVTSRVADGPAASTQNVQRGLSLGRGDSVSTPRGRMEKTWGLMGRSGEQYWLPIAPPSRTNLPSGCSAAPRSTPPSTIHPGWTLLTPPDQEVPECTGWASPRQKLRVGAQPMGAAVVGGSPGSGGGVLRLTRSLGFDHRGSGCRAMALGEPANAGGQ